MRAIPAILSLLVLAVLVPSSHADTAEDVFRTLGVTVPRDDAFAWAVSGPGGQTLYAIDALAPGVGVGGYRPGCQDAPNTADLGVRAPGAALRALGRVSTWTLHGLTSLAGAPVVGAGRQALLLYRRHCGTESTVGGVDPLQRLSLARSPFGQRPREAVALTDNAEPQTASVAADPQGDLAVAWYEPGNPKRPFGFEVLHLRLGNMSGTLGPDVRINRRGHTAQSYVIGWATDRTLVLAYGDGQQQRLRLAAHGRLGVPRVLGAQTKGYPRLCLRERGADGAGALIWNSVSFGDEDHRSWSYSVAIRAAHGQQFGRPVTLAEGTGTDRYARSGEGCAVLPDGRVLAAWESPRDPWPVFAAVLRASDAKARPERISPDSRFSSVRVPSSPGSLVQWTSPPGPDLESALGAGGVFGAATFAPDRFPTVDGIHLVDSRTGG